MVKTPENFSEYLETLKIMASYLGPQRSFRSNLEFFLQLLAKRHDFLRAHLVLFEPETGLLRLRHAYSSQEVNEATYSPGVGVTGEVFATGKSIIVEKLKGDTHFLSLLFNRTDEEMEKLAFISVPVLSPVEANPLNARDIIGTLNVDTMGGNREDLEWRCLFLEVVASLIANGSAYLQEELSRLWRVDTATNSMQEEDGNYFLFSKIMRHLVEQASHLAQGRAPLLLVGENGVGKEFLARRIHRASSRKDMPFVSSYLATLSDEKMLAELVGYQKGVFAGALQTQKGLFEQAQYGTIFLDGVEYLNKECQEALLRLLQEHEITRLGGSSLSCDVRVVASSCVSLEQLVQEGKFLKELFVRLNLYSLYVPPLRERREDIIPLAEYFLSQIAEQENSGSKQNTNDKAVKRISYPALQLLTHYYWPGNIPELQKCMEQAAQNCSDQVIRASDLPPSLQTAESTDTENDLSLGDAVARFEKEMIVDALVKASGNVLKAAKILKSSYRIVNYKVKKYNIDPRHFTVRKV